MQESLLSSLPVGGACPWKMNMVLDTNEPSCRVHRERLREFEYCDGAGRYDKEWIM